MATPNFPCVLVPLVDLVFPAIAMTFISSRSKK